MNIYSSGQDQDKGFDPANRVIKNIQCCFHELGHGEEINHKFFLSSYYANMGNSPPLIISCDNLEYLHALKQQARNNLYYEDEDKSNPNRLGLDAEMRVELSNSEISVIRADALIFKGIPDESIGVLGASGDAHPIMMFDDENRIACYISGAHAAIKQGVLQHSFERMLAMGANPNHIQLVIGPGLGPKSYEFGDNAPQIFSIPEEEKARVCKDVIDTAGKRKCLIDMTELVCLQLKDKLPRERIHNIDLDTMGFDLYDEITENNISTFKRKTTLNFKELSKSGPLFFGARRTIMEQSSDLMEQNSGAFNTVGRHAAGFCL